MHNPVWIIRRLVVFISLGYTRETEASWGILFYQI
jgi:hypothetical protein